VASLALSDATEICELLALLEGYCLKQLVLPISEPLRVQLQDVVDQMAKLVFPADADRFIDLDEAFHCAIVAAAQLRTVLRVWSDISALHGVLVTLSIRRLSLNAAVIAARHQVILDAISAPEATTRVAVKVAKEHYYSLARVLNEGGMTLSHTELGEA
jgi:DNA-binding GntR family transcriptional regulator